MNLCGILLQKLEWSIICAATIFFGVYVVVEYMLQHNKVEKKSILIMCNKLHFLENFT